MRAAQEWVEILGNRNERIEFAEKPHLLKSWIKLIQQDVLDHAAKVADGLVHSPECEDAWSITRSGAFIEFKSKLTQEADALRK